MCASSSKGTNFLQAPIWTDVNDSFAQAYFEAASAGAEMRQTTTALEAIRDALNARMDVFTTSVVFDEQIGRGDLERLVPTLVQLRDQFETKAIAEVVENLKAAFSRSQEEGWHSWLSTYCRSFDDRSWWTKFAAEITAKGLQWSPLPEWPVDRIRDVVQKAFRARWADTYDWFRLLADQDLPPNDNAMFLNIAAQIQLYHFLQPTRAKELLERADQIAPGNTAVLRCWGDYWLQVENLEEARKCFEKLVSKRPDIAGGFIGLGDYSDKSKDPNTAESYYRQSVLNAPGMLDGYQRLLSWHGKNEWFENRQILLEPIVKRMLALADFKAPAWFDLAFIYKQNGLFEKARETFMKSINLDPKYGMAHTWLGYTWLEEAAGVASETEKAELFNNAQSCFEQTIAVESESIDGYWAMSLLAIERQEWEDALKWCDRSLRCHSEWESFVCVRRADIFRQQGRLEEAEKELLRSIELEPVNPNAADGLSQVALAFEEKNEYDAALKNLNKWREVRGESIEYLFKNRIGNLRYRAGDYAAAAEMYRQSLELAPRDDVIQSNLALALENLQQPGERLAQLEEAVAALRQAVEINSGNVEYKKRLHNLEAERKFIAVYGEEALKIEPTINAIRVEVQDSLFPDLLNDTHTLLSDDTLAKAEAMRSRIQQQYGLTIPGVNFGVLAYFPNSPEYTIRIMEGVAYVGNVEPGGRFVPYEDVALDQPSAPTGTWLEDGVLSAGSKEIWKVNDYILHHVQNIAEQNLAEFVGHQETFDYLEDSGLDAAKAILEKPNELTRAVQVLRGLLRMRISIGAVEVIIKEFTRMRESGLDVKAILDSLSVTLNEAREDEHNQRSSNPQASA